VRIDAGIKKGEYIAVDVKYAIYQALGKGKTKFIGVTGERTPCRCPYCLIGGIGLGESRKFKVNNEKNCKQANIIKEIEKEVGIKWKD